MFAKGVWFWMHDVSSVLLSEGLSTKYKSHSYSAEIVAALGFSLDMLVCVLGCFFCEPLHLQFSSDDQAKAPPVSGALGAVPGSGSSSSPFSIFPWRVAGGAAASGLLKGLSPGGWGVQGDALHGSETLQGPSSSFWEPPALKCLPNMCEVPSGWGRYRRESHSPVPPCSVSPLFPQPLLAAAAKLKVLKISHFYCTAPFRLPGSFMLWAEWHVSLFWGKNRF